MPFTVKASFRGKTRVVSFDQGSGFPPHAIINAKLRSVLDLPPGDLGWWHVYLSPGQGFPETKFRRHICSEEEYVKAISPFEIAGVTFDSPTLSFQVSPRSDPKFRSANHYHKHCSSMSSLQDAGEKAQSRLDDLTAVHASCSADWDLRESVLAVDAYQQRFEILQEKSQSLSQIAQTKQTVKNHEEAVRSFSEKVLGDAVIQRETKRETNAQADTLSLIAAWKDQQAQVQQREQTATTNLTPPVLPAATGTHSDLPPVASIGSALWESHPVHGQIPHAFTAFPDLDSIPNFSRYGHGAAQSPLEAPMRRLTERIQSIRPASQALGAQAQAAAHAAQTQVQQQLREASTGLASDLKGVFEGFLAHLGGQLATFEEGFVGRPQQTNVSDGHATPTQQGQPDQEYDWSIHNKVCDGCGQTPRLINFKCQSCADYDLCTNCITRLSEDAGFHAQDHTFVVMPHQGLATRISKDHAQSTVDEYKLRSGECGRVGGHRHHRYKHGRGGHHRHGSPKTVSDGHATPTQQSQPNQEYDWSIHNKVCDGCGQTPMNFDFKCLSCADYHLCTTCITRLAKDRSLHPQDHVFDVMPDQGSATRISKDHAQSTVDESKLRSSEGGRVGGHRHHRYKHDRGGHHHHDSPKTRQHNAICDVCNNQIQGDRYKCFDCPDWDACGDCFKKTDTVHPGHSLALLRYGTDFINRTASVSPLTLHRTAECNRCSGPILGTRYKCIHPNCSDFDLCAGCEAAPGPATDYHDQTHPMIKMNVPVSFGMGETNTNATLEAFRQSGWGVSVANRLDASDHGTIKGTESVKASEAKASVHEPEASSDTPKVADDAQTQAVVKSECPSSETAQTLANTSQFVPTPAQDIAQDIDNTSQISPISIQAQDKIASEPSPGRSATFVSDITIPPGTLQLPHSNFVKIWELVNDGTLPLAPSTSLRFCGGQAFSGSLKRELGRRIEPGETFTVTLPGLIVPDTPGYSSLGCYRLYDEDGVPFGNRLWIEVAVSNSNNEDMGSSSLLMPGSYTKLHQSLVTPSDAASEVSHSAQTPVPPVIPPTETHAKSATTASSDWDKDSVGSFTNDGETELGEMLSVTNLESDFEMVEESDTDSF